MAGEVIPLAVYLFIEGYEMKNKRIKAASVKYAKAHTVSTASIFSAVLFFIFGGVALSNGLNNLGPILIAFGALWLFLGLLPLAAISGWVIAVVSVVAVIGVTMFSIPYMDAAITEFIAIITGEIEGLIPDIPVFTWPWP